MWSLGICGSEISGWTASPAQPGNISPSFSSYFGGTKLLHNHYLWHSGINSNFPPNPVHKPRYYHHMPESCSCVYRLLPVVNVSPVGFKSMPACLVIGLTSANSLKTNGAPHRMFLPMKCAFFPSGKIKRCPGRVGKALESSDSSRHIWECERSPDEPGGGCHKPKGRTGPGQPWLLCVPSDIGCQSTKTHTGDPR